MKITLLVFHERASSGSSWWCESPDLPGFYAVDSSLEGLLGRAESSVQEMLEEDELVGDGQELEFRYHLQGAPHSTEGDADVMVREVGETRIEWLMRDPDTEGDEGVLISG